MVTTFQPTLHDCWACRDLKRFRLVLKGNGGIPIGDKQQQQQQQSTLSSSNPRSPMQSFTSTANHCPPSEVNRRDHLGRTVLHLIATSIEPVSIDYLTALLAHPSVNVNLQDHESGWTALHRALYHGNLLTALTLLKRSSPADLRIKDFEGLTPFDLYNSTVHGTNPSSLFTEGGELLTWGANRNYTLGLGNSDDRALPDRVNFRRSDADENSIRSKEPGSIFDRIKVKDVAMNKFATVVMTGERHNNVWVCGIGANGRIGRAPQTQVNLEPLRDFHEVASSIAIGPDHTCILTTNGEVFTFGHNRFLQLGYSLENGQGLVSSTGSTKGSGGAATATFGVSNSSIPNLELDVQISPRKVVGQLKREAVRGIAAGKLHSAAFTSQALYTWGTNTGQLGYDRAATPVQITPRKVTSITSNQQIVSIAVTDFATACLFLNGDVLLLHNDTSFFVRFPPPGFSSDSNVFRPRQARPKPSIRKIIAGTGNTFAAISDMGDMWQFSLEHPSEYTQSSGSNAKVNIKPQLIWSVRKNKKIGAAKDVALGSGSDLILVTESGHVFVRSKKTDSVNSILIGSGGGKGKSGWRPVPFLQRVFKVAISESGGLAAIKLDAKIREIRIRGNSLCDDLQDLLPHLKAYSFTDTKDEEHTIAGSLAEANAGVEIEEDSEEEGADEDSDTENIGQSYIAMAQTIAEAARRWTGSNEDSQKYGPHNVHLPPFGCDMFLIAGNRYLPVHRAIFSARLPILAAVLENPPSKGTGSAPQGVLVRKVGKSVTMMLEGCSFGTAIFLLHYLYTDDLPPVWTASIGLRVEKLFSSVKLQTSQIHTQLKSLATTLDLPALWPSLNSPVPKPPTSTLSANLDAFFNRQVETSIEQSPHHDVQLQFADRTIPAHSVILRRSPFFAALFQPDWTSTRWSDGVINVDMAHVRWEVARMVLLHLYTDGQSELFTGSDENRNLDQFIDFVVEVLALSNELLLTKFKLICSAMLRKRVIHSNVAATLSDADFYHAVSLKEATMDYITRILESLLESGMLDTLEPRMIKNLSVCIREKQDERMHRKARDKYMSSLIVKHQDYYFDLDLPSPSLGLAAAKVPKRQPRSSPHFGPTKGRRIGIASSPLTSPYLRPLSTVPQGSTNTDSGLFMFSMDDEAEAESGGEWQSVSQGGRNRGNRSPSLEESTPFRLPPVKQPEQRSAAPWKSKTIEAEKATAIPTSTPPTSVNNSSDLLSIMAAEQSQRRGARPLASPYATPTGPMTPSGTTTPNLGTSSEVLSLSLQATMKLSQKDRKRQLLQGQGQQSSIPQPSTSSATPSIAASPWHTPAKVPIAAPLQSPPSVITSPIAATKMGPVHTPTRIQQARPAVPKWTPSSANIETSGGSVWASTPGGNTTSTPLGSSPATLGIEANTRRATHSSYNDPASSSSNHGSTVTTKSFAEIQAEELKRYEQANSTPNTSKLKTFAQLQEEDRLENERFRLEEKKKEEFEMWFEEESRRVKQQQQQQQQSQGQSQASKGKSNPPRRSKGGKAKKSSNQIDENSREGPSTVKPNEGASILSKRGKAKNRTSDSTVTPSTSAPDSTAL